MDGQRSPYPKIHKESVTVQGLRVAPGMLPARGQQDQGAPREHGGPGAIMRLGSREAAFRAARLTHLCPAALHHSPCAEELMSRESTHKPA